MEVYVLIAIAAVLGLIAWLLFSNTKKIHKPRYTEGKEKLPLSELDKMLNNITKKHKNLEDSNNPAEDNEDSNDETDNTAENDKIDTENVSKSKKSGSQHKKKFDLESAVISSAILNKKRKL